MTDPLYYFAYGSNMSRLRLEARVACTVSPGIASLPGHRLAFHKVGRDGSAKCDAWQTDHPDDCVLGVLYRLDSDALATLDRIEGRGAGYERQSLMVTDSAGLVVTAETYLATRIDMALRPFSWYREHVLRGAIAASLPESYVAGIRSVPAKRDPDSQRHARELAIYTNPGKEPERNG
jgi:cation transport regulator ChaC